MLLDERDDAPSDAPIAPKERAPPKETHSLFNPAPLRILPKPKAALVIGKNENDIGAAYSLFL